MRLSGGMHIAFGLLSVLPLLPAWGRPTPECFEAGAPVFQKFDSVWLRGPEETGVSAQQNGFTIYVPPKRAVAYLAPYFDTDRGRDLLSRIVASVPVRFDLEAPGIPGVLDRGAEYMFAAALETGEARVVVNATGDWVSRIIVERWSSCASGRGRVFRTVNGEEILRVQDVYI